MESRDETPSTLTMNRSRLGFHDEGPSLVRRSQVNAMWNHEPIPAAGGTSSGMSSLTSTMLSRTAMMQLLPAASTSLLLREQRLGGFSGQRRQTIALGQSSNNDYKEPQSKLEKDHQREAVLANTANGLLLGAKRLKSSHERKRALSDVLHGSDVSSLLKQLRQEAFVGIIDKDYHAPYFVPLVSQHYGSTTTTKNKSKAKCMESIEGGGQGDTQDHMLQSANPFHEELACISSEEMLPSQDAIMMVDSSIDKVATSDLSTSSTTASSIIREPLRKRSRPTLDIAARTAASTQLKRLGTPGA